VLRALLVLLFRPVVVVMMCMIEGAPVGEGKIVASIELLGDYYCTLFVVRARCLLYAQRRPCW
jgi:hypothetical protein